MESIGRAIGASFALTGFAVAISAGLLAQNSAVTVLGRAIVVLIVCRMVGSALGWVLSRIASEAVAREIESIQAASAVASAVTSSAGAESELAGEIGAGPLEGRRAA